jgi:hypothetical protein
MMTVAELIEKLNKCSSDALVVVEDSEYGFDTDWSVLVLDASVDRRGSLRPCVDYVSQYNSSHEHVERVVALTRHGHGSGYNVVEL